MCCDYSFEHLGDDAALFGRVDLGPSFGGAGTVGSPNVAHPAVAEHTAGAATQKWPGAHIARLFLQPDVLAGAVVALQHVANFVGRERVQLFDSDDCE